MRTTSRTEKSSETDVSCGTTAMACAACRAERAPYKSPPSKSTAPPDGLSARESARTSVDLPEPFGPITPTKRPGISASDKAASAGGVPGAYCTEIFSA